MIQVASDSFERLDEARSAALAVRLAELMGLYRRPAGEPLDRRVVDELAEALAKAGIAERVALAAQFRGRQRGRLAAALLSALEDSPLPRPEIPALADILGLERLSELAGVSTPSLRRYSTGERTTPDAAAQRIHFLVRLVAVLAGSYNEFGVRRWFERPRSQLDGHAPAEFLAGDWDPDQPGPARVLGLAETLLA
jgi:hypothetical protein